MGPKQHWVILPIYHFLFILNDGFPTIVISAVNVSFECAFCNFFHWCIYDHALNEQTNFMLKTQDWRVWVFAMSQQSGL